MIIDGLWAEFDKRSADAKSRWWAQATIFVYSRKAEWHIMDSVNRYRRRWGLEPLPVRLDRGGP